ncbi:toll-like receptor 12 [Salminus brasiliensis]|uniref:toll-like receptor 12 n=1 Tax=Salminus brasiliensis TaxID=930266 RepID=UPI003B82D979
MEIYLSATINLPVSLWLTVILYCSIFGNVNALIAKHCVTFEEHLLDDIGRTVPCCHHPGLGPYGECNIADFRTELSEVGPGIRSLCIYSQSEVIPANAFSHLTTLELLYITGNLLKRVHSGAFSGLLNLRYLTVLFNDHDCSSVAIEPTIFAGLNRLEELSLIGLRWARVPNNTFDPLLGLARLLLNRICVQDLGEVFCHLPNGMSHLEHLKVINSGITSIRNIGCPASSNRPWPSNVLAGIQTLDLSKNLIRIIEANSLVVFQNLSSIVLSFYGVWLGSIWESRVGEVSKLELEGILLNEYHTNFKDLCQLVSHLNLQSLVLVYVKVDTLSSEDLSDCGTGLKELSIFNSEIQRLDPGFWTSISGIKILHMANTRLTTATFCAAGNGTLWNLTTLGLGNNQLMVVKTNQFFCMPVLEQLLLNDNRITTLEPGAFRGLLHLKILKLNSNLIKRLSVNDFLSLRALEVVLIDNNVIENIDYGTFQDQRELKELTFGRLEYVYTLHLSMLFYGFPEKMQRLSIDAHFGTTIYVGNVGQPKNSFILELSGDSLNIGDLYSPFLESVRELKLNGSTFFFKCFFFVPYFSNLESLELLGNPERVHVNYTGINNLRYLKRLKLVNLNFSNHTNPGMTFWNLKLLRVLVLYNCRLSFLTKRMFRDLQSLQLLRLYSVSPLILHDGMFDVLPALRAVVLDRVDFRCDCENGWLLDWAESTHQVQVIYMQRQQCIWHYQKRNYLATMEKLCQTDVQYLCYLSTAITITLLLTASAGYRFAYWPCVVVFFRLRGYVERKFGRKRRIKRRERQRDGEVEEEVRYDAFVSFCRHDEAWVLKELAPRLEEQGQPRLQLCLHSRDFEVGKGIVDNIAESIYSSRRTVCVLSRRYLRSDWCSLEMRVATHRLLEEQKHRLILIFLEHISPFELTAFHRLAKLVKSRTYLDWPQNESERIHFWERLRRNIADEEMVS